MKYLVLLIAAACYGQTAAPLSPNSPYVGSAPATCTVGQIYSTTAGVLYSCTATNTWTAVGGSSTGYNTWQAPQSAVSMTGSDVSSGWDLALSSGLTAGACLRIEVGVTPGASPLTYKLKIGTTFGGATTIATPWTSGGPVAGILQSILVYCNNPGVQNAQFAFYPTPVSYWTTGTSGSSQIATDGAWYVPSALGLSATNLHLYVSLNAASGTATPQYFHVTQE